MLIEYINAALAIAKYEIVEDDGSIYGYIPRLKGVWANAATLEACRDELQSVLERWILVGVRFGDKSPTL
ncbi:MAG: type II toxin-antitoxin system HicB family antitoxin [Planctomycetota bacterium]|nr:type II toxin-antitoxin system HicB family antitoxin [Planctomycetota bacterium]